MKIEKLRENIPYTQEVYNKKINEIIDVVNKHIFPTEFQSMGKED